MQTKMFRLTTCLDRYAQTDIYILLPTQTGRLGRWIYSDSQEDRLRQTYSPRDKVQPTDKGKPFKLKRMPVKCKFYPLKG